MFNKKDNTFHDIRSKSVQQWLNAMGSHRDPEVRGGVKATLDHVAELKQTIEQLEQKNRLKDAYLKKLKEKTAVHSFE